MLTTIENYYNKLGLNPMLLKRKMSKLAAHPDIAEEFASWIENQVFLDENCVTVDGYTAKKIADLSEFLYGEGAFMLLIELRDDPTRAYERIKEGFSIK